MCSLYVVMLLSCGIGPRSVLVDLLSTIFRTVPLLEVISEVLYPRTWIEVAGGDGGGGPREHPNLKNGEVFFVGGDAVGWG
ncbi:MAG: hypothetical protein QM303_00005, partial [Bacillota bacterium]|nr:hypothetical protein [Bacillota bacterium]